MQPNGLKEFLRQHNLAIGSNWFRAMWRRPSHLQDIVDLVEFVDMTTEVRAAVVKALSRMADFHAGEELVRAAQALTATLPHGRVVLVSTSVEGAAIAAVASALLPTRDVHWFLISASRRADLPDGKVVVVEPVDAGEGWRTTMKAVIPGAQIFIAPD